MILEDDLGCTVQGGSHGCKLYEHVRTVLPILHHLFHMFKVTDSSCKAVQNSLGLGMHMAVSMTMAAFMDMIFHAVAVYDTVTVIMVINIVFVQINTGFP